MGTLLGADRRADLDGLRPRAGNGRVVLAAPQRSHRALDFARRIRRLRIAALERARSVGLAEQCRPGRGRLGNLEAARTAYRESLELRRQLRATLGDTPQALRDLSISLDNVGQVEGDLGNLEAARTAYRESLELRRHLRAALGDTPQALRDLSVSLEQCRPDRGRSRQSGGRPHRLSREPGAAPPSARGARRHPAGLARPVGLARQCRPDRGRSRQSGGRPHRLSREPGAAPPSARGARRHPAGLARPVGLARQCRPDRARSRQSGGRPHRLSREPGASPPSARGARRHPAGLARPVGLARTMSARPSAISAIWRPPAPPIARAWRSRAGSPAASRISRNTARIWPGSRRGQQILTISHRCANIIAGMYRGRVSSQGAGPVFSLYYQGKQATPPGGRCLRRGHSLFVALDHRRNGEQPCAEAGTTNCERCRHVAEPRLRPVRRRSCI